VKGIDRPIRPEKPDVLTVERFYQDLHRKCDLSRFAGCPFASGCIVSPLVHRPALALAGFTAKYPFQCVQIIGEIEIEYLKSLSLSARRKSWGRVLKKGAPMVIFADGCSPDGTAASQAAGKKIPLFLTRFSSERFYSAAQRYLSDFFSPKTSMHGTLVEVYGVGMLYIGMSGIGKSECALDLVSRGHMLVSDDIVHITRGNDRLIGRSNELLGHHMEIRGVGILNIQHLCGIRSIRSQKSIDVLMELAPWNSEENYERTRINESNVEILGISIPHVVIPISPGKNISAISELIALDIIARENGTNSAREFNLKLISSMKKKDRPRAMPA
jgi:HPr kinase/phosphorylase